MKNHKVQLLHSTRSEEIETFITLTNIQDRENIPMEERHQPHNHVEPKRTTTPPPPPMPGEWYKAPHTLSLG